MKILPKDNQTITTLKKNLPTVSEVLPDSRATIDGNITLIINYLTKTPVTLYFRNEEPLHANTYSNEEERFLHKLHLHIESIIGNLVRSSR